MPSRPDSPAAPNLRNHASRLARIAGFTLVTAAVVFFAALLAVRFILYPQIESHPEDIAAMLSRELGRPVEIDSIRTGWRGWNPELGVKGLRVRDPRSALSTPLIELPDVSGVVSWTSLLTADLRLHELTIVRPYLPLRRDAQGGLHAAGLQIDATGAAADSRFTAWLLRQRLIVVRDAVIAWNDELRGAPPLVLEDVQFRLESGFGSHRFGLRGKPPAQIAAPIDVRGELTAVSFPDWRNAAGRVYLRLDYADVAAWTAWIPGIEAVQSGKGALRLWIGFARGAIGDLVADLELASVRTRLADDLPALDLSSVSGRVTWSQEGVHRTLTTRALQFAERGGASIAPTDLDVRFDVDPDGSTTTGRIESTALEIGPWSALASRLPLPPKVREHLARHAPQGTLSGGEYEWEGPAGAPSTFRARAAFAGLGLRAVDALPGFSGASGRFEATHAGGAIQLASRNLTLTMPKAFAEPLVLESAAGRVKWERRAGGEVAVALDDLQLANPHVALAVQGSWKSTPKGPGEVDLAARISRAEAKHVHRYLPGAVGRETIAWLRDSLHGGRVDDARLALKGDLARFPFADGKAGTFTVRINVLDATLDYANGWPPLTGVDAEVRIDGRRLDISASRGRVLGATLGRTSVAIADLALDHPVLAVDGEARGPTSEFLQFIRISPVSAWIDHQTDAATAVGDGKLALKLDLALGVAEAEPKVAGDYQFIDNQLRLPGVPLLDAVNGHVAFTEKELNARDVALEILGGPARVTIASREARMQVGARGHASIAAVKRELGASPIAERLSGETDWQLALDTRQGFTSWTLESSLRGVSVNLPPPIGKAAADAVALKVERRALGKEGVRDAIVIDYGATGRIVAHRRLEAAGATTDRALLLLGKAVQGNAAPERAGIAIRGNATTVNVDEWLAIADVITPGRTAGAPSLDLEAIDIEAVELIALGRSYDATTLSARRAAKQWRIRVNARQLEGNAQWEAAGSTLANGRLSAQLARLDFNALRESSVNEPPRPEAARREGSANTWPELDVRAERFIARNGNLGRMELVARPDGTDWRVDRFSLINEAGRIDAQGTWRLVGKQQSTLFDVTIDVTDASAYLARMGLPGDVKGAPAKLAGKISWPGSPSDFEYEKLSGNFSVAVGAGQFTKMDPGVGKLLGVLSLQALPRRIALDFRDVFSEGFAFDTMAGNVSIASGVMHTDDLAVSGPSAKVLLAGDVDLEKETQVLNVRVQPSLSAVVSTGAGAAAVVLLAANPLVGAAVGAGTLLAQKIMQDPIEQMFSYDYAVRGSWSDPVVERVASRPLPRLGEAPKGTAPAK